MRNFISLSILFLFSACQNSAIEEVRKTAAESVQSGNSFAKQVIMQKQDEWQQMNIVNYKYIWKNTCYCPPEFIRPIEVQVVNRKVNTARYIENGLDVSAEVEASIKTIDQVFAIANKYVDTAETVSINYANQWPIPENIFIDRDARMADEEIQFSISDFSEL